MIQKISLKIEDKELSQEKPLESLSIVFSGDSINSKNNTLSSYSIKLKDFLSASNLRPHKKIVDGKDYYAIYLTIPNKNNYRPKDFIPLYTRDLITGRITINNNPSLFNWDNVISKTEYIINTFIRSR